MAVSCREEERRNTAIGVGLLKRDETQSPGKELDDIERNVRREKQ